MSISLAIVEDLAEVREGLQQFISLNNEFKVLDTYQTAEEALYELPRLRPDIVIMDINLPGMSGFEAVSLLKSWPETRAIPIIGLSAAALSKDQAKARDTGFYRYLTKPVKVAELTAALETLLMPVE